MTAPEIMLALDLGTTGIKAGAFDQDLHCLGSHSVENHLHYPAPGLVEQDPAHFVNSALALARQLAVELGDRAKYVTAIVCSGQMGGVLGIDHDWQAVGHFDAILDTRSNVVRPLIEPHSKHILAHCGGLTTQLEKMLYWRDYNPDAYARIEKFVGLGGYLAGVLAGLTVADAYIDLTFSSVNGALNAVTGDWEADLLGALAFPLAKLPRVVTSETVVGTLTPALAEKLGLPLGVQILAGAGDGAATYAGSGINRQGQALDLSGTSCALGAYSDKFLPDVDEQLFVNMKSPTDPGWFVIYINHFGLTHRWFLDAFCAELIEARGVHGAYATMDTEAAALAPGSGGVLAVPHLSGQTSPPRPYTRGAWLGFGLGYTRAHFYRSLLEAHAFEYCGAKTHLKQLSPTMQLQEVFVSGGGSRSDVWNQIKADVLGSAYRRLVDSDLSTLRGDALVAAKARGWQPPADFLTFDREYAPVAANTARYAALLGDFQALNGGLDPLMARLFS
jgi:xylulokinase